VYQVTEEQQKKIEEKYGRLMYTIAHRIGGDKITNDFEDSVQNLKISALDAVTTFAKKENKEFDEFFDTLEFSKYIKTVLWNRKNSQGQGIQKRKGLSSYVTIEEDLLTQEDMEGHEEPLDLSGFKDILSKMPGEERELIEEIAKDFSLIKPNGKFNMDKLSKNLNMTKTKLKEKIKTLQRTLYEYK